jgi:putative DNA primase/helicase
MNSAPPHLVIFNNGVLNLHDGVLYPHDRRILSTKLHPYDYTPAARCDNWLAFLAAVFEGDAERVALLQEWLGYMLSGSYAYQKIMLMLGPKRSGKGTIGEVMEALVGAGNYTGASLASFARDDFLDSLRGKTCAFSGDTEKKISSMIVETVVERIKKISGYDPVDFGRKYKDRATCRLPTRITLAANHIPRLFDDSDALSSRLLLLTFDVSFYDREDPHLRGRLCAEVSGIASWALVGYARLCAAGRFTSPRAAEAEAGFIAESYSPIRAFIDARVVLGGDGVVSSVHMYQAYREWATLDAAEYILGRNAFLSSFKDATRGSGCKYGPHRSGDSVVKGFRGVTLAGGVMSAVFGGQP